MKSTNHCLITVLLLLSSFWLQQKAQAETLYALPTNWLETSTHSNNRVNTNLLLPILDKKETYHLSVNTGQIGLVASLLNKEDIPNSETNINIKKSQKIGSEYALPTQSSNTNQFSYRLGEWVTPSVNSIGECYWQPVILNQSIYYNRGRVGIGTATPGADLHVHGNMKLGSNIGTVGINSFAGGDGSTASGTNAFAFGKNTKASGTDAVAIGFWSEASNDKSFALGFYNLSNTPSSYLFGQWLKSTISSNITMGFGAGQSLLTNNKHRSLMMGMNSDLPTFYMSPSAGEGTTGRIGMGNMTDPQAKLHIYSDVDEAASLKLEHRTTGTNRYAEISLGTHSIRAANTENMVFSTPAGNRHFVFENGKVGIGTNNPKATLDVNGDSKIKGVLYVEEVIVEEASNWPDFVFGTNYKLMNLKELKAFITTHKHLPDVPQADENGKLQQVELAKMNALLLQKIEELTLYILEQEERITRLERALE